MGNNKPNIHYTKFLKNFESSVNFETDSRSFAHPILLMQQNLQRQMLRVWTGNLVFHERAAATEVKLLQMTSCVAAEYVAITADVCCIDMKTQTPHPCPTHACISSSSPPWRFWKLLGDCSCHLNVLRSLKSRTGIDFANCMPEYPSYPSMRAACRFVSFFIENLKGPRSQNILEPCFSPVWVLSFPRQSPHIKKIAMFIFWWVSLSPLVPNNNPFFLMRPCKALTYWPGSVRVCLCFSSYLNEDHFHFGSIRARTICRGTFCPVLTSPKVF